MVSRFEHFSASISCIYRYIQRIERTEMEKYGLKGPHAQCLLAMKKHPEGITAARLCEVCEKDKAAVSRILAELEEALVNQTPVSQYSQNITKHAQWAQELQKKYVFTHENVAEILRKELGMVFAQVLEDAGVYKLNESGREGFVRFLASIN